VIVPWYPGPFWCPFCDRAVTAVQRPSSSSGSTVWRPALDRHAGQPGPDRHGPDAALVACAAL